MNTNTAIIPNPRLFAPHPNFSDEVNRNFIQSEIEGGVYLREVPQGAELEVKTENRFYRIKNLGEGNAMISGHPEFCPEPVMVRIEGSNWGGSMLKTNYIGRGMHLEFRHPAFNRITTSRIVEIRAVQ